MVALDNNQFQLNQESSLNTDYKEYCNDTLYLKY